MARKKFKNSEDREAFFRLFRKNFVTLKALKDKDWYSFEKDINLKRSRVAYLAWRDNYYPTVIELYKLSKQFHVPMEDLLENILQITKSNKLKIVKYHDLRT
jgi:hypothetical protein